MHIGACHMWFKHISFMKEREKGLGKAKKKDMFSPLHAVYKLLITYFRTKNTPNDCNCRVKDMCPLDGQCQTSGFIYQAPVIRQQ